MINQDKKLESMLLGYRFKAPPEEWKRFFTSVVWEDIQGMILEGIEAGRDDLEDVNSRNEAAAYIKGGIQSWRDQLLWPETIPATLLEQLEEQKNE